MIALVRIAASAAAIVFVSTSASAQQLAPPVERGEFYVETANRCGVVFTMADVTPTRRTLAEFEKTYADMVWRGRCVDGLVDGPGNFSAPGGPISEYPQEYILGRHAGPLELSRSGETIYWSAGKIFSGGDIIYYSGAKHAKIYDGTKPFGPRWGYYGQSLYGADRSNSIEAEDDRCMNNSLEKRTKKFGCSYANNYRAYSITVGAPGPKGATYRYILCPDPRTPVGCDQLWMTAGKHVFDDIQAFIAPIEAELAARRDRYKRLITPAWRAQAAARRHEILENGTADQLQDEVASLVTLDDMDGAVRLSQQLMQRFPASPAVAQAKQRLTTGYCLRAGPKVQLMVQDALFLQQLYSTDPCRNSDIAADKVKLALGLIEPARQYEAQYAEDDRRSAAYVAQQRAQNSASWGAALGVLTQVLANRIAPTAPVVTYPGTAVPAPSTTYSAPGTTTYQGTNTAIAVPGTGRDFATGGDGMFRVDPATGCQQYELVNEGGGRRHYQIRNACNYAITIWAKAELDGRWNDGYDLSREIAAHGTAQSHSILAQQLQVTVMAVCPAKATLESRIGKKVTGVYTKNRNGVVGCWSVLENTGVGTSN